MAKDWQRKLKHELKTEVLKEFEGWSSSDFIEYILSQRELISVLEKQKIDKDTSASEKGTKEPLNESKFKQEWSYPTKIHFLLKLYQKPLTSEDLHCFFLKMDSHYKDYNSPRNNLSVALGRASKSGRIKKIKEPGIKLKYYALPEWLDKEGALTEQHKEQIKQF